MSLLIEPLQYEFMQRGMIAAILVGIVCAVVGTYVLLQGMAYFGDALAHTILPGIALGYLITGGARESLFWWVLGTAVVAALGIGAISKKGEIEEDTTSGIIFAGLFALGIALISTVRGYAVDLSHFLFGDVLSVSTQSLWLILIFGGLVLLVIFALYKEFLTLSFEPILSATLRLPVGMLDNLLLALIAVTVAVSLQTVGVALMVAMLVIPAATASLLTRRLARMMAFAALFSSLSGIIGLYLSYYLSIVSGAAIVSTATLFFFVVKASASSVPIGKPRESSGGYGGIEMDYTRSQTTRFLSASAVLLGGSFRSRVLHHVKEKYRAVAPELGLDLGLLVRVCKFMDNRETVYRILFVSVGVVAILTGFASTSTAIAIFVLGAWWLQGYKSYEEQHQLAKPFSKDRYNPDEVANKFRAELGTELAGCIPEDGQNIIVYQGFSPFIGAGSDLGGWSFAVDLSCPKDQMGREEKPIPFEASELNATIEDSIKSLGFEGVVVKNCLFVNGVDIRDDKAVLPNMFDRPVQQVMPDVLNQYLINIDPRIRYYKWIRVYDWGNELVMSHFLRCVLKGQNLFVEINRFLLTPLDTHYRSIDAVASKTWWHTVGLLLRALIVGPFAAVGAWPALLVKIIELVSRKLGLEGWWRRREIKSNPLYDYGATRGVRESVSSQRFVHYFQRLDREMYIKIIEREMLDTIVEFLDDHNIDTSEIKERQTTIMNQGIIVQGGDVEAQSLAVGTGAQAALTQPATPQTEGPRRRRRRVDL